MDDARTSQSGRTDAVTAGAATPLRMLVLAVVMVLGVGCSEDLGGDNDAGGADGGADIEVGLDGGMDAQDGNTGDTDPDGTADGESGEDADGDDGPGWDIRQPDTGDDADMGLQPLALTGITPARGPLEGSTQFTIRGQGFTEDTVVFFGGNEATVNVVEGSLVGQAPAGSSTGTVTVKAIDPDTGEAQLTDGYTYTATLRVDSVTPSKISTEGGTEITLKGAGFTQETRASIGGTTAPNTEFVDASTLRVLTPPGTAGKALLRVTNADDTYRMPNAVTYYDPVVIDSVRPATGDVSGGQTVTLNGSGFTNGMTVLFGSSQATVQSVDSNGTSAQVTVPASARGVGPVDVVAQAPVGSSDVLTKGYVYYSGTPTLDVVKVIPDTVQASGGTTLQIIGPGVDSAQLNVGGTVVTPTQTGQGWVEVAAPAHAPGTVDITATNQDSTDTLSNALEYVPDLSVGSASPAEGPTAGGTTVTLNGTGFSGTQSVTFGGVQAAYTVISDTEIEATAPSRAPGTVDIVVERGDMSATLEDGFSFTEPLDVFGLAPARGSMAGNTYVEIRGQGFVGTTTPSVTFGGQPAASVKVLDSQTLAARTPPANPATVDVNVTRDSTTITSPDRFTYYNPGARSGGTWGGPINGSVNISVYGTNGSPIQYAFVMLSTSANTQYTGQTNEDGLVTLSGPDIKGAQTITAIAKNYSTTTVQQVDAENVTIFLSPAPSSGPPPQGPPTATFKGKLTGLDKIARNGPYEVREAQIYTTKRSPWSNNPDPGSGAVLNSNGDYTLTSRTGDLALVAIGGLRNRNTEVFTPLQMGVVRYQQASGDTTYNRDIDLNIPLTTSVDVKVNNAPNISQGTQVRSMNSYLDFGFEGVFGQLPRATSSSDVVTLDNHPSLSGQLSGVEMIFEGGVFTFTDQGQLGAPQSIGIKKGVGSTSGTVQMPPLPAVPEISVPGPPDYRVGPGGTISFQTNSSNRPDFWRIQVLGAFGTTVLEAFADGTDNTVNLPSFPDLSDMPEEIRPQPYPGGGYTLQIIGIEHPTATYKNFGYSDLSIGSWDAYSADVSGIQF